MKLRLPSWSRVRVPHVRDTVTVNGSRIDLTLLARVLVAKRVGVGQTTSRAATKIVRER